MPAHWSSSSSSRSSATVIGARLIWWQVVQQPWLARDGAPPAGPGRSASRRAWRDHRRQRRAAGDVGRAAVGVRNATHASTTSGRRRDCWRRCSGCRWPRLREPTRHAIGPGSGSSVAWPPRRPNAIRELDLPGIGMLPETKRVYPVGGVARDTTIAAQLIGFVDVEGSGQYGIEGGENGLLAGTPGIGDRPGGRRRPADRRLGDAAARAGRRCRPAHSPSMRACSTCSSRRSGRPTARTTRAGATGVIMDAETGAILGDGELSRRTTPTSSRRRMASGSPTRPSPASTSPGR